jgi:hypothetical protein
MDLMAMPSLSQEGTAMRRPQAAGTTLQVIEPLVDRVKVGQWHLRTGHIFLGQLLRLVAENHVMKNKSDVNTRVTVVAVAVPFTASADTISRNLRSAMVAP